MPHHGVLKEDSLSIKLRVVFDGSCPTSTGVSLNQIQSVGPTVQSDLFSIICRFRLHRYVVSADVVKMYRQFRVAEDQRQFQRILWRASPEMSLRIYNLNTITYGTSSASFLATRCLKQIGIDCEASDPEVSRIIQRDFYVDDLMSGFNTLSEAQTNCDSLNKILGSYGLQLSKWLSNEPQVLIDVEKEKIHPDLYNFSSASKTLGLLWANLPDKFLFYIPESSPRKITKRTILSEVSQIFDPLGLVQPCTMKAKILLQQLWLKRIGWDEVPPEEIVKDWLKIKSTLPSLNKISFQRRAICISPKSVTLHAFSDASTKGYGACIYLRSVSQDNVVSCHMLCAKGKVAPLKPISIPRLELCGAVVLVKLVHQVISALNIHLDSLVFWTDSTIVLCWLNMHPSKLNTFVANRVSLIQELSLGASWRHVDTHSNPSDFISRGCNPTTLLTSDIWIHGPEWLSLHDSQWPNSKFDLPDIPEVKPSENLISCAIVSESFPISNWSKIVRLKRVTAYCLRFLSNCRKAKVDREIGFLSVAELNASMSVLVKISQRESFPTELEILTNKKVLKPSQLRNLNSFLSPDGTLLVGGRLDYSSYCYEKRHPALLHSNHHLSKLIVEAEHLRLLHAGPQQMLASLRERYWIIGGRNICKKVFRSCVVCIRHNPHTVNPIMGNLPPCRVEKAYTFQYTGLDFCGPFLTKDRIGRGSKQNKCYICVFICLVTKAVHLELVSSLSTDSFMQCFRRFVSRRGKPSSVYSDNGTNFVGAHSLLKELGMFLKTNENELSSLAAKNELIWHFIPSYSPHFGGIWERAVRSVKFHLRRILGNNVLTFEDFATFLAQIECVLNSRPITPLSSEVSDLNVLTPGHFLTGRALSAIPDYNVTDITPNRLNRYQQVQQLAQQFWDRWSKEYLQLLQLRNKWQSNPPAFKINSVVLLKQDRSPPLRWRLGRIVELHPGKDSVHRVATVRTSSGVVRRAIASLCPLLPA